MHGGGGENSHVMINVNDGHGNWVLMETGGAHNDTGGTASTPRQTDQPRQRIIKSGQTSGTCRGQSE
jgi:hypothetical protein